MTSKYKIRNTLKNLPFYSEEIKSFKKNNNKKSNNTKILSELPLFSKKPKKLSNYQLSKELPFFPKKSKKLNKRQILKYILPLYDTVGISRSQYAHKGYAETYNVEVADKISLNDSLFLAKSSIIDLFKDLLQEKRGFKYTLSTTITLKIWNNTYDVEKVYFNSGAIMFHSESLSEPGSNFAINSLSTFDSIFSDSKAESESDFNSMFMNLDICIFFCLIFTLY